MKSEVKYCSSKTKQLLELEVFHFSDEMVSADIQMHLAFVFFAGEVGKYGNLEEFIRKSKLGYLPHPND